jgi:hypothetical protein
MSIGKNDPIQRDDTRLIRSIRDGYGAPELTPARRAAIDARVRERVERRNSFGLLTSVALSGALAAGLFLLVRADRTATEPSAGPETVAAAPAARTAPDAAWADALLFDPAGESISQGGFDELPDEYRAITEVLLEG